MNNKLTDLGFLKKITHHNTILIKETLRDIMNSNKQYLEEMEESLKLFDWLHLSEIAHKFKSPAEILGAASLKIALEDIEECSKDKDFERMSQLLNSLKILNKVTKQELEEELLNIL